MFYNTTSFIGDALKKAERKNHTQTQIILAIYSEVRKATPSKIWEICNQHALRWPLTSIRRAITDLTNEGRLIKITEMHKGIYGKPEHCWKVNGG